MTTGQRKPPPGAPDRGAEKTRKMPAMRADAAGVHVDAARKSALRADTVRKVSPPRSDADRRSERPTLTPDEVSTARHRPLRGNEAQIVPPPPKVPSIIVPDANDVGTEPDAKRALGPTWERRGGEDWAARAKKPR